MIYGYARVSTTKQSHDGTSLDSQEKLLRTHGATTIYRESYTGTGQDRPELTELVNKLQRGDTLIVTKLDRLARSIKAGAEIIDKLAGKGVRLHILNMGVMDDSPTGRLIRNVMLAFAEFERDMIVERTSEGKAHAKATNPDFKDGRPFIPTPDFAKFREKVKKGHLSVTEACRELGISRDTWYRRVRAMSA